MAGSRHSRGSSDYWDARSAIVVTGIDRQRHTSDVSLLVRSKKDDSVADVDGLDQLDRHRVLVRRIVGYVRMRVDKSLILRVRDHRCVHPGRMHGVDSNAVLGELIRVQAHKTDHAVFGCRVSGLTGKSVQTNAR